MTNRKLFAAMLAMALVLGMTACGKGKSGGKAADTSKTAESSKAAESGKTADTSKTSDSKSSSSSGGWTAVDVSKIFGDSINGIAWGNNKFVAVGNKDLYNGAIATSTDGVKWTAVDVTGIYGADDFTDMTGGITYFNGKFLVRNFNYGEATSTDGVKWTPDKIGKIPLAYGNGTFVGRGFGAGGHNDKIVYSSDGVKWTEIADVIFPHPSLKKVESFTPTRIAYGKDKFVAVGSDDRWIGKMAYSTDGIKWIPVDLGTVFDHSSGSKTEKAHISTIIYANGKFVAGGRYGKMAYSSDGVNWTAVSDSTFDTKTIYAIAFGNNKFVAGGQEGKMATSTDGVKWTAVDTGTIFDCSYTSGTIYKGYISDIVFGNNTFVARGENGKMAYSKGK